MLFYYYAHWLLYLEVLLKTKAKQQKKLNGSTLNLPVLLSHHILHIKFKRAKVAPDSTLRLIPVYSINVYRSCYFFISSLSFFITSSFVYSTFCSLNLALRILPLKLISRFMLNTLFGFIDQYAYKCMYVIWLFISRWKKIYRSIDVFSLIYFLFFLLYLA